MVDDIASAASFGSGFGAVFFALRWVVMWASGRADRRQDRLDAEDARLNGEWREIRNEMKGRMATIERQSAALRFAFHHVSAALMQLDPQNPALLRAEQALAVAFPLDFSLVTEMAGAALDAEQMKQEAGQ